MKRTTEYEYNDQCESVEISVSSTASDSLHHLAFENSLQPNIISDVKSEIIILVNEATCQLLGYTKDELIGLSCREIFDINGNAYGRMLKERSSEGQSSAEIRVIHKNGNSIPCEITSAVFPGAELEKCITTLSDMSRKILKQKRRDARKNELVAADVLIAKASQKIIDTNRKKVVDENIVIAAAKSDARFAEHTEWIKYIGRASYDLMWDWDVASGEIYVGESITELFGYNVRNNTVNYSDFLSCLVEPDKDLVERKLFLALNSDKKSWNDNYLFKRYDGSVASTTCRASIVRDENGKAIRLIGAIHDISKLQELEDKLNSQIISGNEDERKILLATKFSLDVNWEWKLENNEIFFGEGFENLYGGLVEQNQCTIDSWGSWIHPGDAETVRKGLQDAINSSASNWQQAYRVNRPDGSVAKVFDRAGIFRLPDGKAYRLIGVMQDLSKSDSLYISGNDIKPGSKDLLINNIKAVIIELIHFTDEQLQENYSDYLSKKLQYDYTYLANTFSESEGIPIQQYIIFQKIERVKELITADGLNLTKIASRLHYSSVAHLSNQFKKITGLTPSQFRHQVQKSPGSTSDV